MIDSADVVVIGSGGPGAPTAFYVARGRRLGLDAERISPDEAHRLNPFLQTEGVLGVMRVGDDLYFDPSQVAIGFARGAEARGATLLPNTTVTRVHMDDGEIAGVE